MSDYGTVEGKHHGDTGPQSRANETTTDSGAGETVTADGIHAHLRTFLRRRVRDGALHMSPSVANP